MSLRDDDVERGNWELSDVRDSLSCPSLSSVDIFGFLDNFLSVRCFIIFTARFLISFLLEWMEEMTVGGISISRYCDVWPPLSPTGNGIERDALQASLSYFLISFLPSPLQVQYLWGSRQRAREWRREATDWGIRLMTLLKEKERERWDEEYLENLPFPFKLDERIESCGFFSKTLLSRFGFSPPRCLIHRQLPSLSLSHLGVTNWPEV